jgi:hypothetical protein
VTKSTHKRVTNCARSLFPRKTAEWNLACYLANREGLSREEIVAPTREYIDLNKLSGVVSCCNI